jgi:probable rRNA maturation factor
MAGTDSITISITAAVGNRYAPFLRRHLREAHRIVGPALKELSVALVGDRRMAQLHEQFMGLRHPTDVLTFPLEYDARGRVVAGEVVVCLPEARRQAKARGIPVERELLLYALHGLLHLCGYNDRTDAAFRTMHRTEDRILAQLGVGPVFKLPQASSPARATDGRWRLRAAPRKKTASRRATGAH